MIDFKNLKKLIIGGIELKQLLINGIQVWKSGLRNLVPTSINTDGTVYGSGRGYTNGYRLSSTGELKTQAYTVTTGFIKASKRNVVRMSGTKWDKYNGYNYFAMYDENFNLIDTINIDGTGDFATRGWSYTSHKLVDLNKTRVYIENGVARFSIEFADASIDYSYIRISAYGVGQVMVVTSDDPIPGPNFKNWARYSTTNDGKTIYNDGLGYKNGYRVRSGGAEAESTDTSCTGYIPVKGSSVIRVSGTSPFKSSTAANAINVFDSSFTNLGQVCGNASGYGIFDDEGAYPSHDSNTVVQYVGYWEWVLPPAESGIAWIRVSGFTYNDGERMIVTVDEPLWDANSFKNWIPYSTTEDGKTIYNGGLGYKEGTRLNSSAAEVSISNYVTTGYFPVKAGDVVRVKGIVWTEAYQTGSYFWTFDSSFAKQKNSRPTSSSEDIVAWVEGNDICVFAIREYATYCAYARFSAHGYGNNIIVTVNEKIVQEET